MGAEEKSEVEACPVGRSQIAKALNGRLDPKESWHREPEKNFGGGGGLTGFVLGKAALVD